VVLRVTHVSIVISIDVREVTKDVEGAAGVAGAQGRRDGSFFESLTGAEPSVMRAVGGFHLDATRHPRKRR
jgi:hypothetical protein